MVLCEMWLKGKKWEVVWERRIKKEEVGRAVWEEEEEKKEDDCETEREDEF